nr:MAG TPA: hypothetical protein [Caudoviricetes sp.]
MSAKRNGRLINFRQFNPLRAGFLLSLLTKK